MDWVAFYKLARLGVLALALVGIAIYLYGSKHAEDFEEPARRMLEEDDPA